MKASDLEKIREDIEFEGFLDAFVNYDDYSWVEDDEFHALRKAFLQATKELSEYLGVEEIVGEINDA